MAAERPENAEERLVAEALHKAFGGPVTPAAFLAGREAILAAAALSAEELAADEELVGEAMAGAFAVALDPEVTAEHLVAIRAAAEAAAERSNVIPLRRFGQQVARHAVAAAVAVSTLAGGSGVAAASTDALPGQMLYPVKRAVEQVMLTAAWTPTAEARVQVKLAARRLSEAELLLAGGAPPASVAPLLTEYDEHVAAVEDLAVTSATVEVAVLQDKADALREQTVTVADEPSGGEAVAAVEPTETSAPVTTTATEPPTSGATESTTSGDQQAAPAPAPSTTSSPKPASDSTATSGSTSGNGSGTTATQPAPSTSSPSPSPTPSPSPSPSPSPTASPSPSPSPSQSPQPAVDESKNPPPAQDKPKQNKQNKPNKPSPSPSASPTVNPERTPVSDSEPVYDAGPLAEWEEQAVSDGS